MLRTLLTWSLLPISLVLVGLGWSRAPRERVIGGYATSLQGRSSSQRHNAGLAAKEIDGRTILPGAEFSFNHAVGSFSRDEGFKKAPVSYNGELIDDWGGGVCQTSTTLYNAALVSGLTILERSHHQFCPSYVSPGRDAAVAYPYIDLRFKNPYSFAVRIQAKLEGEDLQVNLVASHPLPASVAVKSIVQDRTEPATFYYGHGTHGHRIRNSGKEGYDTQVTRKIGSQQELISQDFYPVMNRVIELR